ncbi:MAG: hypothetical protein WC962_09675 [Phycisphaerae bacterium]|jgi:hypothetical protein
MAKLKANEYWALIDKWGNVKDSKLYNDKGKKELKDCCPPESKTREKSCAWTEPQDPKCCDKCWEACGCRIVKVQLVVIE